jgi:hypothetical protein
MGVVDTFGQADQQPNTGDIISSYQPDTNTKTITLTKSNHKPDNNTLNSILSLIEFTHTDPT